MALIKPVEVYGSVVGWKRDCEESGKTRVEETKTEVLCHLLEK